MSTINPHLNTSLRKALKHFNHVSHVLVSCLPHHPSLSPSRHPSVFLCPSKSTGLNVGGWAQSTGSHSYPLVRLTLNHEETPLPSTPELNYVTKTIESKGI